MIDRTVCYEHGLACNSRAGAVIEVFLFRRREPLGREVRRIVLNRAVLERNEHFYERVRYPLFVRGGIPCRFCLYDTVFKHGDFIREPVVIPVLFLAPVVEHIRINSHAALAGDRFHDREVRAQIGVEFFHAIRRRAVVIRYEIVYERVVIGVDVLCEFDVQILFELHKRIGGLAGGSRTLNVEILDADLLEELHIALHRAPVVEVQVVVAVVVVVGVNHKVVANRAPPLELLADRLVRFAGGIVDRMALTAVVSAVLDKHVRFELNRLVRGNVLAVYFLYGRLDVAEITEPAEENASDAFGVILGDPCVDIVRNRIEETRVNAARAAVIAARFGTYSALANRAVILVPEHKILRTRIAFDDFLEICDVFGAHSLVGKAEVFFFALAFRVRVEPFGMCVVILRRRYELERRVAVESAAEKHSVERVTHPVARYLPHTGAIHDFRYVVRFLARNVYYGHIGFERKVIEIPQRHGGCLFVGDVIGGISLE